MTRAVSLMIGAVALAEGPWLVAARAQQSVFRAATDVVPVTVSVMQGRTSVTGLTVHDFELTDNGVRQDVEAVLLEGQPIDVTLVLDAVPDPEIEQLKRGIDATARMVGMLRPDDRLRIIDTGGDLHASGPMRSLSGKLGAGMLESTAGQSLLDGLFAALAWPVDPTRRHLIVVFTDGNDSWSTLAPAQLPAIASRSDAVLHAVFYNGPPGDHDVAPMSSGLSDWQASYRAVDAAVQRTGGALHVIADRVAGFTLVLADFRSCYLLRYTPRGVTPAGSHKIAVKVTRPGSYTVRARQGYER